MMNKHILLAAVCCLFTFSANAGFGSYKGHNSSAGVVAPIEIEQGGLYHLVVEVQFLYEPYETKPYESDAYQNLIQRLNLEWRGLAIQKILESPQIKVSGLSGLKKVIEGEIETLIKGTKAKYGISQNAEVVFSISDFYLVQQED